MVRFVCVWCFLRDAAPRLLPFCSHYTPHATLTPADDGSSWYDTFENFFYDASGFKMDFGETLFLFCRSAYLLSFF